MNTSIRFKSATRLIICLQLIAISFSCMCVSHATNAAYVHVLKNETAETRLHLGELEAFASGVTPNGSGGATFGGMATSTYDIGDGALTAFGAGNLYPILGTTNSIQHGAANQNPDNLLQSAGAVWSTNPGLGTESQYTLDLGGTHDVTTIRMWPRADGCCAERWRNLEVQLLDAGRNPIPGTKVLATTPGGNVPLEFLFPEASSINKHHDRSFHLGRLLPRYRRSVVQSARRQRGSWIRTGDHRAGRDDLLHARRERSA